MTEEKKMTHCWMNQISEYDSLKLHLDENKFIDEIEKWLDLET